MSKSFGNEIYYFQKFVIQKEMRHGVHKNHEYQWKHALVTHVNGNFNETTD